MAADTFVGCPFLFCLFCDSEESRGARPTQSTHYSLPFTHYPPQHRTVDKVNKRVELCMAGLEKKAIEVGGVTIARVGKVVPAKGLRLLLQDGSTGLVHLTDINDKLVANPTQGIKDQAFVKVCVCVSFIFGYYNFCDFMRHKHNTGFFPTYFPSLSLFRSRCCPRRRAARTTAPCAPLP